MSSNHWLRGIIPSIHLLQGPMTSAWSRERIEYSSRPLFMSCYQLTCDFRKARSAGSSTFSQNYLTLPPGKTVFS